MRGRKPKPAAQKILEGNPGKRPMNAREPKPVMGAPDMPEHLDAEAKAEWARIVPELQGMGLLARCDRAALAAYCQTYSRWAHAEKQLQKSEPVVKTAQGNVIQHPYVGVANTALKLMHKMLTEFGLTPSSRTRVHAAPDTSAQDEEDGFGDAPRPMRIAQ